MHTRDYYGWLDRFRLLAALLVVAIHTSPLGSFSPEADFFLTRILARIAVPFFFMVTGQFVAGLLGDSYFGLVQKLPALETMYEFFFRICSHTRNGLFFAPVFLVLGAWCSRGNRRGAAAHPESGFASAMCSRAVLSGKNRQVFLTHPSPTGRAWIELDRTALIRNVEYLRSLMPEGCRLMPAVKANAYGHGAVWTARELNRLGVDAFCVACLSEAIALRKAKIKGEILILGYTAPEDFRLLAYYRLTQTVIDHEYAGKLADADRMLHVHIGIDTGMHRLGIRCQDIEDILAVFEMKNLVIDGMFTHLCVCDSLLPEDEAFTLDQINAFYKVAEILESRGIPCPRLHLQSSYGLLNYPGLRADYVRAGIALYGVPDSAQNTAFSGKMTLFGAMGNRLPIIPCADWAHGITRPAGEKTFFRNHLYPVLSLKARVASVRTLYAGDSAGYGLAFTAKQNMRIAVLSIGYADGLPRELSCGRGCVLIHGCKAPVIGRICMDQTLVDVSGVPQISAGDIAVLVGTSDDAEITAAELAFQCGTITNELLSRLGDRLERIIKDSC